MKKTYFLMLLTLSLLTLSACSVLTGSIVITEKLDGSGCGFQFQEWSGENQCKLSLRALDELKIDTICEGGDIRLTIQVENGKEVYTGNHLQTGYFTVKAPKEGTYVLSVRGSKASGDIAVTNLTEP